MKKDYLLFFFGLFFTYLAGCVSANLSEVAFSPTRQQFADGDSIAIDQVRASSSRLAVGDTVVVNGRYVLQSRSEARLGLSLTTNGPSGWTPVQPDSNKTIGAGAGKFELRHKIHSPGSLHVTFYPVRSGSSFGGVYFASVGPQH